MNIPRVCNILIDIEKAKRIITLCPRCLSAYQNAGYVAQRDYTVTVKGACDFCGYASGWTYYITDEKAIIRKRG